MDEQKISTVQKHKTTFQLIVISTFLIISSQNVLGATPAEIQEWLDAHNTYRALHGVPNVTWSTTVAQSAQAYADTCPSGHSYHPQYGENLAWSYGQNPSFGDVVKWWYDEEQYYDYNNPGFSSTTGHFTQVVWKNTTEIGCGYRSGCSISLLGKTFTDVWVCQYNPHGNVSGQFADNVFPPGTPVPGTPVPSVPGNKDNSFLPAIFELLLNK